MIVIPAPRWRGPARVATSALDASTGSFDARQRGTGAGIVVGAGWLSSPAIDTNNRPRDGAGPSPARMMHGVQRLQTFARDVCVDGGGRNVGMAEQHLHGAQVGAVIEQVRRERVPQGVR